MGNFEFGNSKMKFNQPVHKWNFVSRFGTDVTADGYYTSVRGLAVDSSGNLYAADSRLNKIIKFDSSGNFIANYSSSRLLVPHKIAVDNSGNIYIADNSLEKVFKFNSSFEYILEFGGYGTNDWQFNHIYGIAVDSSGNVYAVDYGSKSIKKFNSSGEYITKWGTTGSGDGQFDQPTGIAVDSSGNVYVTDEGSNDRIQKFNSSGEYITKWGTTGGGYGQFNNPRSIAIDSYGNVYVAENNGVRIQKFTTADGITYTYNSKVSSTGASTLPSYNYTAIVGFTDLFEIACDSDGSLVYTAEGSFANFRIMQFNGSLAYQKTFGYWKRN